MPNLLFLVPSVIIPILILRYSAKKDRVHTRAYLNSLPVKDRPVHAWVSGEASPAAIVISTIVSVAFVFLACYWTL